jgi:uncharacterized protein (TIGR03086 family)
MVATSQLPDGAPPQVGGYIFRPSLVTSFDDAGFSQDPQAAWLVRRDDIVEILDQPGALERETRGAYGQMTVDRHLSYVFYDTVVHTWDLAKAVAQPVIIDRRLADRALKTLVDLSENHDVYRAGWLASGKAIDEGRDVIDRLIAFAGRDPDWRPQP